MPKNRPIFYSALMLTGVNLLLRFVGTSFQVFLSGRIGAAGIGLLQLVMSVGALATVAGIGGIRTATMYLTAEEIGKNRPRNTVWVISGCVLYSIVFSGTVAGLLYHFAPWIASNWIGDNRTAEALQLFAAFLPVVCLTAVMTGYFTGANRIGTLAAVEVAEQAVSMALTVLLLGFWAGHDPVRACLSVILGNSTGGCLTLLCLIFLRMRDHCPSPSPIPIRSRILQTALPLALADDLKTGINTVESLMVPKRLALHPDTDNPLASFGLVSGMVFPVIMFPTALLFGLTELLVPELARCNAAGSSARIRYLLHRSLKVSLIYGLLLGGLFYLTADHLCSWLYGTTQAAPSVRAYGLLIPMLYCDLLTDALTKGLGQQKICVRYNIFTSFLDVVFLWILLPEFGMQGYYISFFITHLINFCLSLRRLLVTTGERISPSIPLRCALAAILSLLTGILVSEPVLRVLCYFLILMSLLFLLQVFSREDVRWLKELVRRTEKSPVPPAQGILSAK